MRLTNVDCHNNYYVPQKNFVLNITIDEYCYSNVIDKLGQLEDIEEELGIDLVTLFKALKNGIYVKETQYSRHADYVDGASLGFGHNSFYFYDAKSRLWNMFFKDYGKTWALTKEELL